MGLQDSMLEYTQKLNDLDQTEDVTRDDKNQELLSPRANVKSEVCVFISSFNTFLWQNIGPEYFLG